MRIKKRGNLEADHGKDHRKAAASSWSTFVVVVDVWIGSNRKEVSNSSAEKLDSTVENALSMAWHLAAFVIWMNSGRLPLPVGCRHVSSSIGGDDVYP
jgi:predicted solute-binding protein